MINRQKVEERNLQREEFMRKAALTACTVALAAGASPASAEENKPFTLGYSAGYLTDPFQAIEVNLTLDAAKKAGVKTLPVANANGDAGRQVTDFHNLVASGAQAIIAMPTDSAALAPAVEFEVSKHVPVVTIDNGATGGKVFMVRADNVQMGKEACHAIGKAIGGRGTVLSLVGDQASSAGRERTNGFNDCMKAEFPDIKVNQQPTYRKSDKAVAAAQTVVSSTPDLSAIYMQATP
jgi:ribose transport system substrate-binding protein